MLIVSVSADSITAFYKDSNEYDVVGPEYQLLGKDSFFSWIANPEGKIGGVELYLSPDSLEYLHLRRLMASIPISPDTPFVEIFFATILDGASVMNNDCGDYYYYLPSEDKVVMFLPSDLSSSDVFLTSNIVNPD